MKTNIQQTRRGFTLVELLVVIVIIAALAGLTAPMVIRQRKKADQTQAISNARQIGLAMLEFESDYGSFPGAATQTQLNVNFPAATVTGDTTGSNGYFRQLFQAGMTQSEEMFYAKVKKSKKPDGNIDTSATALATNEVGFSYIISGLEGLSSAGNPARIICATPSAPGSTTDFDIDPFDSKAVLLRIDNSVAAVTISAAANTSTGKALVGGLDVLDSNNPIWGGVITPTLVLPDGL